MPETKELAQLRLAALRRFSGVSGKPYTELLDEIEAWHKACGWWLESSGSVSHPSETKLGALLHWLDYSDEYFRSFLINAGYSSEQVNYAIGSDVQNDFRQFGTAIKSLLSKAP